MKGYIGTDNRPISQNPTFKSITVGVSPNVTQIDTTGTSRAKGIGTCWRDELNDLTVILKNNPSDKITIDAAEGTVHFKDTATPSDFALMNVQLNHDRKLGMAISPHLHWIQATSITPNWLIQYRWQGNGKTRATSWINNRWVSSVFTWTTSLTPMNQITEFSDITPSEDGLSDILQVRIIRDATNATSLFPGAAILTGDAIAVNFDVHIEIDMLGSAEEYLK